MELKEQVGSLELSKRLKELGVKQESLFYWWGHGSFYEVETEHNFFSGGGYIGQNTEQYSAFTVAELGEMLPKNIAKSGNIYIPQFYYGHCWFYYYRMGGSGTYLFEPVIEANTEADARAKMLIYLIKNKLINL